MNRDSDKDTATARQRRAEAACQEADQRLAIAREPYASAFARADAALDARDGVQAVIQLAEAERLRPEYLAAQEGYRVAAKELKAAIEACLALGQAGDGPAQGRRGDAQPGDQ